MDAVDQPEPYGEGPGWCGMNAFHQTDPAQPVDIASLPGDALLTRRQLEQVTGFRSQTFKNWAAAGRGPRITIVEKCPRYRAADVRAWLAGREGV